MGICKALFVLSFVIIARIRIRCTDLYFFLLHDLDLFSGFLVECVLGTFNGIYRFLPDPLTLFVDFL
jgi:hypothetical protein